MLIIQCWYWQEKSSICLHRNLCLGAHLRREMDTIKGKMQAKKRALERNRLDVRFEDYLVQLFSCQSDKGDALNQVTTRREKQTLLFLWAMAVVPSTLGWISSSASKLNSSSKTREFHHNLLWCPPHPHARHFSGPLPPPSCQLSPSQRRHDVALLLQTSLSE